MVFLNKHTSSTRQFELELCWSSSRITSGFLTITSTRVSTSVSGFDEVAGWGVEAKNNANFFCRKNNKP